jgi:hypothetical protein
MARLFARIPGRSQGKWASRQGHDWRLARSSLDAEEASGGRTYTAAHPTTKPGSFRLLADIAIYRVEPIDGISQREARRDHCRPPDEVEHSANLAFRR